MKILIVGDPGVGKMTLAKNFSGHDFFKGGPPIFFLKESVIEKKSIKYQISVYKNTYQDFFYLGVLGGIIMFDITNRKTFDNLQKWVQEIWGKNGKGIIPIILLGNKIDLRDQYYDNTITKEIDQYCSKLNKVMKKHDYRVQYREVSAKMNLNVDIGDILDPLGRIYFNYLERQARR